MTRRAGQSRIIVGLTGGIAAGKSFVARGLLEAAADLSLDAILIDSDQLSRHAWDDPTCRQKLAAILGEAVCPPLPALIDRSAVAKVIFADESKRHAVEAVIHPFISAERSRRIEATAAQLIIVDSPLLLETGLDRMCDAVVFVDTPAAERLERAVKRGWSPAALAAREASQWPIERKKEHSSYVIAGTYRRDELAESCRSVLREIFTRG